MIEITSRNKDRGKFNRIRVFVSGEAKPDMPVPPYGSTRGDGSAEDKAWKAYNRAEVANQRDLIEEALAQNPELATKLGKLSFSRKAGCGCGCSPGFIAEGQGSQDIWITRTAPPAPVVEADPNEGWLTAGSIADSAVDGSAFQNMGFQ